MTDPNLNFSTGGHPSTAQIAARDHALYLERESKRLARMTPEQRERERLFFLERRRAARAEHLAKYPTQQ